MRILNISGLGLQPSCRSGFGEGLKGRQGITWLSLRLEDPQRVVALPHPEVHQGAGPVPSDNRAWLLLLMLTFPPSLNSTGRLTLFLKDSCVTQSSRELGTETEIMPFRRRTSPCLGLLESISMKAHSLPNFSCLLIFLSSPLFGPPSSLSTSLSLSITPYYSRQDVDRALFPAIS